MPVALVLRRSRRGFRSRQGSLVGACARPANSDGREKVPAGRVTRRIRNPRDRRQELLHRMQRRQVDRKSTGAELLVALRFLGGRPGQALDFAQLVALRALETVKAVNQPGIGGNDVSMRDDVAEARRGFRECRRESSARRPRPRSAGSCPPHQNRETAPRRPTAIPSRPAGPPANAG